MKKIFQKIVASVLAVTTLTVSIVGINASAATGYRSLTGGTGSLMVAEGMIYASTYKNSTSAAKYMLAQITDYTGTKNSGTLSASTNNGTTASCTIYGTFSHGWSYHIVDASYGTLSVSR